MTLPHATVGGILNPGDLQAAKENFLANLYAAEKEQKTSPGKIIAGNLFEVGKMIGLSEVDAERVARDLVHHDLIHFMGGPNVTLTERGRIDIEGALHERSLPFRDKLRRRFASPAVSGAVAGALVSVAVSILTASDIPWWVKMILHKK